MYLAILRTNKSCTFTYPSTIRFSKQQNKSWIFRFTLCTNTNKSIRHKSINTFKKNMTQISGTSAANFSNTRRIINKALTELAPATLKRDPTLLSGAEPSKHSRLFL